MATQTIDLLLKQAKKDGRVWVAAATRKIAEKWAKQTGVTQQQFHYIYNIFDAFRLRRGTTVFIESSLLDSEEASLVRLRQELRDRFDAGLIQLVEVQVK